jgi:hypothetical protein
MAGFLKACMRNTSTSLTGDCFSRGGDIRFRTAIKIIHVKKTINVMLNHTIEGMIGRAAGVNTWVSVVIKNP